jgi:hypothetical protein
MNIKTGKIDVVEILSPGQTGKQMNTKLKKAFVDKLGTVECIPQSGNCAL